MTGDLFDYTPQPAPEHIPYARGSDTSRAAAENYRPMLTPHEQKVLDALEAAGLNGLTCFECERITKLEHQTASARFRGLELKGLIQKTEDKRPTKSERFKATVYVLARLAA